MGVLFPRRWLPLIMLLATPTASYAAPASAMVDINGFAFTPPQVTVHVGTRITWTNHDDIPHTVTSADKPRLFGSSALDTDDQFSHLFDKPGTYHYFCAIHPHMQGVVVVQ